ncbi:MAG: cytochrome c biogenesis protein CcdA, partial [Actinobacteria bacterium]|nr:cytochrome c biogenesis protein CcdA [Actinomycetota bacterium]
MSPLLLPVLAVVAGVISFSSPCCLPLIPGYLSYISALPVADLGTRSARAVTLKAALLFVAGFSLVFTALGVSFALVGSLLLRNVPAITRVSGVMIIVLGLAMAGVLRLPFLQRERRFDLGRLPKGPKAAPFMGMAFAFGWAPCIGPVLATILATAAAGKLSWTASIAAASRSTASTTSSGCTCTPPFECGRQASTTAVAPSCAGRISRPSGRSSSSAGPSGSPAAATLPMAVSARLPRTRAGIRFTSPRKVATKGSRGWRYSSSGLPTCTTLPSRIRAMRSAMNIASSASWV